MELTELIKDYVATELLSGIELDFLEGELWETTQHIAEISIVFKAPKNICKKLGLDENLVGNYAVQQFLTPQDH